MFWLKFWRVCVLGKWWHKGALAASLMFDLLLLFDTIYVALFALLIDLQPCLCLLPVLPWLVRYYAGHFTYLACCTICCCCLFFLDSLCARLAFVCCTCFASLLASLQHVVLCTFHAALAFVLQFFFSSFIPFCEPKRKTLCDLQFGRK